MLRRLRRFFVIRTRFEACLLIYALAVGATERGVQYLQEYPGMGGWLLFVACTGSVFMAGALILDGVRARNMKRRATDAAGADFSEARIGDRRAHRG
jgi:hypothetical protein